MYIHNVFVPRLFTSERRIKIYTLHMPILLIVRRTVINNLTIFIYITIPNCYHANIISVVYRLE